jgi:hypothetical protein
MHLEQIMKQLHVQLVVLDNQNLFRHPLTFEPMRLGGGTRGELDGAGLPSRRRPDGSSPRSGDWRKNVNNL